MIKQFPVIWTLCIGGALSSRTLTKESGQVLDYAEIYN